MVVVCVKIGSKELSLSVQNKQTFSGLKTAIKRSGFDVDYLYDHSGKRYKDEEIVSSFAKTGQTLVLLAKLRVAKILLGLVERPVYTTTTTREESDSDEEGDSYGYSDAEILRFLNDEIKRLS